MIRHAATLFWCALFLAGGGGIAWWLWRAPPAQPAEKAASVRVVRTITATPQSVPIKLTTWGTVVPAQRLVVRAQVEGRVAAHHPALADHGFVATGDVLVQLEQADYRVALEDAKAALEEARFERDVEAGRRKVAAREWDVFGANATGGKPLDPDLALREPQLRRVRALLVRAEQGIAAARLNLARTEITAPFPAVVLDEAIEVGTLLRPGDPVCTLAGTEAYWVRVTLPAAQLTRLRLPAEGQPGANATVVVERGDAPPVERAGAVIRLLPDLEPDGLMARALVAVPDPLGCAVAAGEPRPEPLLLGSYARVDVDAGVLEDVLVLPREALHEGRELWVVDADGALQIRPATARWREADSVYVEAAMAAGESIVVAGLRVALPGQKVRAQPIEQGEVSKR